MKKFLTFLALIAASIGLIDAQTTITWNLTTSGDLSGASSEASITVSDVTVGSNITINGIKNYTETNIGTLFSPTTDLKENKTPKTDGSNLVTFKFSIPSGFKFKPTNLSFFGAKDGSGNNHYADVKLNNDEIITKYAFERGTPGATKSQAIESGTEYEGEVLLTFNLYGKSTSATKGWVLGNVVLTGEVINAGDARVNAPISWNPESVTLKVRDAFTAPTLTNTENLPVTFASNNTAVATVDEQGNIALVDGGIGTAIISATYTGTEPDAAEPSTYKTTVANTTITVNTNVADVHQWVEYPAATLPALNGIWQATATSGTVAAATDLIADENINIKTVYDANYANYAKAYLGYDFAGALQAGRVAADPTVEVPTGTAQNGNTPLVVTPAKDMKVYMFVRRQALEQDITENDDVANNVITKTHLWGMAPNDGKSVYAVDQSDPTVKLDEELIFGAYMNEAAQGSNDYLTTAVVWNLKAGKTYTIWTKGTTICMHGIGYVLEPESAFGEGVLAAPTVWPLDKSAMLPLDGEFVLTFGADVQIDGKADLNGTALDMTAEGATVKIPYTGLTPQTAYTLTIPAKAIGNAEAANEALTFTFTSGVANTLYYTDYRVYPYDFYTQYGNIPGNTDVLAKNSTDKTATVAGITYYSGTKGRAVLLHDNVASDDLTADYGPNTEADKGASPRCMQLIGGGNGLYVEFPEVQGPVDLTFYIANANKTAGGTIVLTDELGDTKTPLASFELGEVKRMSKFTYTYPYKGAVRLRLYNMKNQININDALIVKGEGEGIDKPVIVDDQAPVLTYSWPSESPYAPVEGNIVLMYNENIATTAKAVVNEVETDIVIDGMTAKIPYAGLENGKQYTVQVPAFTDEAGNATEPLTMTLSTVAADVLYYTDFANYPFSYWEKHYNIPNEAGDNNDIIAKNSTDVLAECGGITYFSGTGGRVVAMGKSNLLDQLHSEADAGATPRCIQVSGGGNELYAELPETNGPCEITIYVGNSTAKEFSFQLRNTKINTVDPIATFSIAPEKAMFKFTHAVTAEGPVQFRIYNMGNQFNIHDILVKKAEGQSGIGAIEAAGDDAAPAEYYNLQGVRVAEGTMLPGIYIKRQGNKATKVYVK